MNRTLRKPFALPLMLIVLAMGLLLTACGGNNNGNNSAAGADPGKTAKEMVDAMVQQVEQPAQMELTADDVSKMYHLDPSLLEDYSIRMPLMNVKTNEVAVLKVKDSKDIAAVEDAVKQRAADVQKSFESYLPDQYENAKNYKLETKGNYVLFVISEPENVDQLIAAFESQFSAK
ncbi:DUF4358 domain-containing protein [Cohnella sp. AR92]|uniref:DUF4358 domain-containing protein n=1 Tax=Cohnella sp. AR92 TaxID=648716 RepID=UPI000F8D4EBF|nr:DUF4358 domain-containing protein [Cohnella sp. AR92]RUS45045.1 DUF4358 domain-containing protein [Cohnella sp. AR92]